MPAGETPSDRILRSIRATIAERYEHDARRPLQGLGTGEGVVAVSLAAGCVDVAAELVSSYGELVSVKVGAKPYPAGSGRPRRVPPLPSTEGEIGGFKLRVEMGTARLRAGYTTTGSVVVTSANTSLVEVFATANPAWLRVQATQEIAGGYSGAVAGAPRRFRLDSTSDVRLPFVLGSSSFAPTPLYVVPPGMYEVIVPVELSVISLGKLQTPLKALASGFTIEVHD